MTTTPLSLAPDPDAAQYEELGINDAATGRLIHTVFSRLIGEASGHRYFSRTTCCGLAGIGRLSFRRHDGTVEPAPFPDLEGFTWPSGDQALLKLGLSPIQLDHEWAREVAVDGTHARLALDVVLAFFPAPLWPIAAEVLTWGPADSSERLERFCRIEALRPVKPSRSRPEGGTIAAATIWVLICETRRLFRAFITLKSRGYPSEKLEPWIVLPAAPSPSELGAVEAHTDRSAPPLMLIRRTLRRLNAEIESRTGRRRRYMRRLLAKRLVLSLLAVTGARVGAITGIRVRDYDPEHRFPDGEIGPALCIYPGKTLNANEPRWKALPDIVALWLEEHIEYNGLHDPDASIWPFWKAGLRNRQVRQMLGGEGSIRPLLPREEGGSIGYPPHTLRHLAEQLAHMVGYHYLAENQEALAFVTPQVLADALLDHVMSSDHLGYKDLDTPDGRERWARVAGLGVWEYLWGDAGARKGPDAERIRQAKDAHGELQAVLGGVQTRIAELRAKRREIERRGQATEKLTTDDLVRLLLQISVVSGELEEEHEELERVQRELFRAEAEHTEARRALIPLPDDAPAPAEADDKPEPVDEPAENREPIRDWLTIAEAAHAFGVSEPTMRRWFRGDLPHPEGDPRNAWQPSETDQVIEIQSARKRRLIVSELDRSRIAPEVMQAIKRMLERPPR